jgi:S1-C subfamily serine protease
MKRTLVIVLAAALVGGLTGAVIGVALDGGDTSSQAADLPIATPTEVSTTPAKNAHQASRADLSPEAVYREDAPSVVLITDTRTQTVPGSLFLPPSKEQVGSLGSGFVIDRQGDVVTNEHVVQGAHGIRVGFSDGASDPADGRSPAAQRRATLEGRQPLTGGRS